MSEIVIGIDPDAKKYGVAQYEDGKLIVLLSQTICEFVSDLEGIANAYKNNQVKFVIEDVQSNSFMYARNRNDNPGIAARMAQNVGMCKHAQQVAEDFIEHYGFELIRVKPSRDNWAKDKSRFERITGWKGRSNEDTRSAAYFGFLKVKRTRAYHDKSGSN